MRKTSGFSITRFSKRGTALRPRQAPEREADFAMPALGHFAVKQFFSAKCCGMIDQTGIAATGAKAPQFKYWTAYPI
jgi:hypothetical protein